MSVVIIAEKPDAARRIAEALAEKKSLKSYMDENKVTYYEFERNGKKHIVACAVGHLFNLAPVEKGWKYPVFSYTWKPSFEVNKQSAFSKKYFDVVKKIVEKGSDFIIATDYDTEGELIGANILRFLANRNDAKRMKFSALTKDELIESYKKVLPHLDFGQLEAGLTRHELDWLWGINITRALTLALKNSAEKGFAILSSGRVQSPTLAILFDRELEIRKFKPKPFWELELHVKINGTEAVASYEKGRIWKKEEADKILQECKGKDAKVKDIKKKKYKQAPPVPFNTTDLQAEAYQQFKFSPQQTMNIAESLYQQGFVSYPRSSVDYEEKIFVIDMNNRIKEVKIGEFIDNLIEKNYDKTKKLDNSEELEINNYKTFAVNLETNKIEVRPITSVIRHSITEPLLELTTEDGRKTRVTKSHSVFVFDNGSLKSIPTSELKVGDYIAIAKSIQFSSSLNEINLLKEIEEKGIEKNFTLANWKINIGLLKHTYGKGSKYNDYRFRNSIPLSSALNFVSVNEILPNTQIKAFSGKNKVSLKIIQKITPSLARFLGYFSSEGAKWCKKGEKASYEINLTQKENEVLEDMKLCLKEILISNNVKETGSGKIKKLRVYGKTPYYLLELFGVEGQALTKKVPEIILSAPDEIVAEYLKAYFAGDGWVDIHARSICARTISRELANGILFLLLRVGIFARVYEIPPKKKRKMKHKSYEIKITGNDNVRKFSIKVGFIKKSHHEKAQKILNMKNLPSSVHIDTIPRFLVNWKELVKGLSQVIKKHTKAHGTKFITIQQLQKISKIKTNYYLIKLLKFLESDVGLSRIVSIKEVKPTNEYVYDLSIDGTNYENFIGGFGLIILHNSSQKLPPSINYERILKALASLPQYKKFAEELLKKEKLVPVEGKKEDPAHPCFPADASFSLNPHSYMSFKDLTKFVKSWEWDERKSSYFGKLSKPIKVLAFDSKNNKILSSFVSGCWKTPFNKTLIKITTKSGNSIELTGNHPIMTLDATKGICFKEARELRAGDILLSKVKEDPVKNEKVIITEEGFVVSIPSDLTFEEIREIKIGRKVDYVYDLEVEKYHTFFVNNFLVHNCVYATHEVPDLSKLTPQQRKIYDLIARRTLAVFGDEALRETNTVSLDVAGHTFLLVGKRTLEPGWTKIYEPYLKREEIILPELKIGQTIKVIKLEELAKETQPPARYSQGSIIKEMEARNLGTRATRSEILQTLYDRGYISGKSIQVTKLGEAVVKALKEYCPKILSEELTRKFEEEMELVYQGKKKREEVVEEAKKTLKEILEEFKANEKKIGKKLLEALMNKREEERKLGNCPNCKTGELRILRSKLSGKFFVGCSNYPNCKTGYPLPAGASIQATGNICEKCGTPIIQVFRKGKRPFRMCLDPKCETKKDWDKKIKKQNISKGKK